MRLKYVTKPKLIDFLRYMDKNKVLLPFRIKYSSFRSKKDMTADISEFYEITETPTLYVFSLKRRYQFLVAPQVYYFSKENFEFQDLQSNPLNLHSRPRSPKFQIRRGRFLVGI